MFVCCFGQRALEHVTWGSSATSLTRIGNIDLVTLCLVRRVGHLTEGNLHPFILAAVASAANTRELSFAAAVFFTACSLGYRKA